MSKENKESKEEKEIVMINRWRNANLSAFLQDPHEQTFFSSGTAARVREMEKKTEDFFLNFQKNCLYKPGR